MFTNILAFFRLLLSPIWSLEPKTHLDKMVDALIDDDKELAEFYLGKHVETIIRKTI